MIKPYKRWTEQEEKTLIEMRMQGLPFSAIVKKVEHNEKSCRNKYDRLFPSESKKAMNRELAEKIQELTDKKLYEDEIAKALGINIGKVRYIKRTFDIHAPAIRVRVGKPRQPLKKDTICWVCKNAIVNCKKPVDGFTATVKEYGNYDPPHYSYLVKSCPNFSPEPYADRLGEEE